MMVRSKRIEEEIRDLFADENGNIPAEKLGELSLWFSNEYTAREIEHKANRVAPPPTARWSDQSLEISFRVLGSILKRCGEFPQSLCISIKDFNTCLRIYGHGDIEKFREALQKSSVTPK